MMPQRCPLLARLPQCDNADDRAAPNPRHVHAVLVCALQLGALVCGALQQAPSLEGEHGSRCDIIRGRQCTITITITTTACTRCLSEIVHLCAHAACVCVTNDFAKGGGGAAVAKCLVCQRPVQQAPLNVVWEALDQWQPLEIQECAQWNHPG